MKYLLKNSFSLLGVLLGSVIFAVLFFSFIGVVQAQSDAIVPKPQVQTGILDSYKAPTTTNCSNGLQADAQCIHIPWIAQYVGAVYKWGLAFGALLSVIMLMMGGVLYIIGGANQTLLGKAKEYILYSLIGVVLILGSYVIFAVINPSINNLPVIDVEIAKEQSIEVLKDPFCDSLDKTKHIIEGFNEDVSKCGQEFTVKPKEVAGGPKVTLTSNTCIASRCEKKYYTCAENDAGKYNCERSFFYGSISDSSNRYIEKVWIVSVPHKGLLGITPANRISEGRVIGKGKKHYTIPYTASLAQKIMEAGTVALEIELNDSGKENSEIAADTFLGGILPAGLFQVITPTVNDHYIVGKSADARFHLRENRWQGVWFDLCENGPVTVWPCKPGDNGSCGSLVLGQNKWSFGAGGVPFNASEVVSGGVQVDINSDYFWEDHGVNCKIAKSIAGVFKVNGSVCLESEREETYKGGELKCIQAGEDTLVWSDGKLGSACANLDGGGLACRDSGATCKYINGGPSECVTDTLGGLDKGTKACWGTCQKFSIETNEIGDACSGANSCGKTSNGVQLFCYEHVCQVGGWGDPCDSSNDCQSTFYCNTVGGTDGGTCSKLHATAYQNCDPSRSDACASGLTCQPGIYSGAGQELTFASGTAVCPETLVNLPGVVSTTNFNVCMPITVSSTSLPVADRQVCSCSDGLDTQCPAGQFCNTEGRNYCAPPIAGGLCDPEENTGIPAAQGYRCDPKTSILYNKDSRLKD